MGRGKIHSIKQRIESTKSTQHITHAMEMVATAKVNKAVKLWKDFGHFWRYLDTVMGLVYDQGLDEAHPFFADGEQTHSQKTAVILITSDMGLCGSFNLDLIRAAQEHADKMEDRFAGYIVIGSKGLSYCRYHHLEQLFGEDKLYDTPRFAVSEMLTNHLLNLYEAGKADSFDIIYSRYASSLLQRPTILPLLPWVKHQPKPDDNIPVEYEFEPPPIALLDTLIPLYLSARIHSLLMETKVSELFSRQNAMRNATENANTLIERFTLEFNKARQASITQEIIEIVNGAEALREG